MKGPARGQIYIVDDDDAVRDSMRALLESFEFHVQDYNSAREFLANYRPNGKACLLLDLHMPVMTGIDLLEHLQARGTELPTIVITGRSDGLLKERALRGGALELIDKPVGDTILLNAICRALDT